MDVFLPLTVPHAVFGILRLAAGTCYRAILLGQVLTPWYGIFGQRHPERHQHQHRLGCRPQDAAQGDTGSTHDGQFAVGRQAAQTDQTADQHRHWQFLVNPSGRGQPDVIQCIHSLVVAAQITQLVNQRKQGSQPGNQANNYHYRPSDGTGNMPVQFTHAAPPQLAPAVRTASTSGCASTTTKRQSGHTTHELATAPVWLATGPCPWLRARLSTGPDSSGTTELPATA